jgi:hypothetical protein
LISLCASDPKGDSLENSWSVAICRSAQVQTVYAENFDGRTNIPHTLPNQSIAGDWGMDCWEPEKLVYPI